MLLKGIEKMAKFDREVYNTIFNDIDTFKEFCATAWNLGSQIAYAQFLNAYICYFAWLNSS